MDTPLLRISSSSLPSAPGFMNSAPDDSNNHISGGTATGITGEGIYPESKLKCEALALNSGTTGEINDNLNSENAKLPALINGSRTRHRLTFLPTDGFRPYPRASIIQFYGWNPQVLENAEFKDPATLSVAAKVQMFNARNSSKKYPVRKCSLTVTNPALKGGNPVAGPTAEKSLTTASGQNSISQASPPTSIIFNPTAMDRDLLPNPDEYDSDESSKLSTSRSLINQSMPSNVTNYSSANIIGSSQATIKIANLPRSESNPSDKESLGTTNSCIERIHPTAVTPPSTFSHKEMETSSILINASGLNTRFSDFHRRDSCRRRSKSVPPELTYHAAQTGTDLLGNTNDYDYSPASAFEPADFNEKCDQIIRTIHDPKQKKCFYVACEILSSEKIFVNILHLLTISFPSSIQSTATRLGLLKGASILPEKDLANIQGELPLIKPINELILKDLYDRIYNWKPGTKIADIFLAKGPFLKHYTHYIKDFEKHAKMLDNLCKKRPHLATAVRVFESSELCKSLNLKSFMLKPVQRMPQYALLLKDYLKTLEEGHPDLEDTKEAIKVVVSVAEHANETIEAEKSFEQLLRLQARLPDFVGVGHNRTIVKEGELQKACRKGNQPRYFVLMRDVLLVTAYRNLSSSTATQDSPLRLRHNIPLNLISVKVPSYDETRHRFSIISRTKSFTCFAKSPRERDEWLEALLNTIDEFKSKRLFTEPILKPDATTCESNRLGTLAPIMVQDSEAPACQSCTKEFTLTFRRHHCRACGHVVCKNCSSNEAPLEYLEYDSGRVCETCYNILLNDFQLNHPKNSLLYVKNHSKFRSKNRGGSLQRDLSCSNETEFPPMAGLPRGTTDTKSNVSGYLFWNEIGIWERNWALLKEDVLNFFNEPHDTIAVKMIPLQEWTLEIGCIEDQDEKFTCFKLTHFDWEEIFIQVEDAAMAENWQSALSQCTTFV